MDDRLPPDVEVCVYRIVQEAFNNVVQHSGATACTVIAARRVRHLWLAIEDNGRGIGATPGRLTRVAGSG